MKSSRRRPQRPPPPETTPVCVSCGAPQPGEYCGACGERRPAARDLTLLGFLRDTVEAVTSHDSRSIRTMRYLVSRPGHLTAEYVSGRRRNYLPPIQVFLITNLIFFLAFQLGVPVLTLTTPLGAHLSSNIYGELAERIMNVHLQNAGISRESAEFDLFRVRFNAVARQHGQTLVIMFAPLFALAIALLRITRREPAAHHLAFALHYLAFCMLLFVAVSLPLPWLRPYAPGLLAADSMVIPLIVLTGMATYLFIGFRRAYNSSGAPALLQSVLVALLFVPLILLFRFVLFLVVLFTL